MKKPGKTVPLLLLACMLTFASGCGTNKNNTDQGDMANNNTTGNQQENAAQTEEMNSLPEDEDNFTGTAGDNTEGNDPFGNDDGLTQTEAFDASDDNVNSVTNGTDSATDDSVNDAGRTAGNGMNDVGNTAGNIADDVGNAAGNVLQDAGDVVGDVADDIGNGIKDLTDGQNTSGKR